MANIYVGFHDQRNSSRILKPPGGGTSDIFGTDPPKVLKKVAVEEKKEANPIIAAREPNNQTITEEKTDYQSSNQNTDQEDKNHSFSADEPIIENLNINEGVNETNGTDVVKQNETKISSATASTISGIIQQQETPIKEPEKRSNRVPPGGYSSGLW